MKRAIAVGATLATTTATTLVAASGASAVPPPPVAPECATYAESTTAISAPTEASNWYATCTPQYGMGKVEFTISSDTDFPADFKPLNDASVAKTINQNSADVAAYINGTLANYGTNAINRIDDGSNPRQQRYRIASNLVGCLSVGISTCSVSASSIHTMTSGPTGVLPFHISSVSSISPAQLPAAVCGDPTAYTSAYKVLFDPVAMTFTQTAGGELWRYDVTIAPQALYMGFSPDFVAHNYTGGAKFCKSQGSFNAVVDALAPGSVLTTSAGVSPAAPIIDNNYWTAYLSLLMQNPYQAASDLNYVGDYPRTANPLPNTGAPDARIPLTAGASLLVLGLAVSLISRRRLRRARSPRA